MCVCGQFFSEEESLNHLERGGVQVWGKGRSDTNLEAGSQPGAMEEPGER